MTFTSFLFRAFRKSYFLIISFFSGIISRIILHGNQVIFFRDIKINGIPIIDVHRTATCEIGRKCKINSGKHFNPIGRNGPTYLIVRENAKLIIGINVGISSSAIISHKEIKIGNNVKIGGNVVIMDTDFHSLDYIKRRCIKDDKTFTINKAIIIGNDVFIGAHSTILKGVEIGDKSIIGASSVVSRNIPPNQIWAGNPIKFIKHIS